MAPRYNIDHSTPCPFMTCVVKVSTRSYGRGQKTIGKVLGKCQGVHSFRMDDNGTVEISGTIDPSELLKLLGRAGRSAELCWLQFGECSNNLFMPPAASGQSSYSHDGRYLHAANVSRPKPPSHQPITNQGYGYDQYGNTGYSSYGNQRSDYHLGYYGGDQQQQQGYYHAHAHAYAQGYPSAHGHAHGYPSSYDDSCATQESPEYQSGYGYGGNETRTRSSGDEVCCTIM